MDPEHTVTVGRGSFPALDDLSCLAENRYFWFCVIHCLSPLLNYSVPDVAGRNIVAGSGYALIGTCCFNAEADTAGGSQSLRAAKSRNQYSSDIAHSTRINETLFPARASQIVFNS